MRNFKKSLSLILVLILVLGTTTAFAAEGDLFLKADDSLIYLSKQMQVDILARKDVQVNENKFKIEVRNKLYDLTAANVAFKKDKANWKDILTVIPEVEVTSISAITAKDNITTVEATVLNAEEGATAVVTLTPDAELELDDVVVEDVEINEEGKVTVAFGILLEGTHTVVVAVEEASNSAEFTVDYTAVNAAVKKVNDADTQTKLWIALQNPLFEGVTIAANLEAYEDDGMVSKVDYKTVAEIIAAVKETNEKLVNEELYEEVKEALEEAYANRVAIFNVLDEYFDGVVFDNMETYVDYIFDVSGEVDLNTMEKIQDNIYFVNVNLLAFELNDYLDELDTDGNATQAEIDEAQRLLDALFALGKDTLPSVVLPELEDYVDVTQAKIDVIQEALDDMNEAIDDANDALAAYVAAGGDVEKAVYTNLEDALAEETKVLADIEGSTANLVADTKALTAVTDAEAAQVAYLAAGGEDDDAVYTDVTTELEKEPIVEADLIAATETLEEATRKLVVYAEIMAATTAGEMRSLLFKFDNNDYLNLSSLQKTEFAGWFIEQIAAETTEPADYGQIDNLLETKVTEYETLIDDVNTAADISAMITALGNLENDAFDVLTTAEQSDVADTVLNGGPFATIAEIVAAMGL